MNAPPAIAFDSIRTEQFSGNARKVAKVKAVQMHLQVDWKVEPGHLRFRITGTFDFHDVESEGDARETSEPLGSIGAVVVIAYTTPDELPDPQGEQWYKDFVRDRAFPDAFPYLREIIGSLSGRLGFANLTLPAIQSPLFQELLDDK